MHHKIRNVLKAVAIAFAETAKAHELGEPLSPSYNFIDDFIAADEACISYDNSELKEITSYSDCFDHVSMVAFYYKEQFSEVNENAYSRLANFNDVGSKRLFVTTLIVSTGCNFDTPFTFKSDNSDENISALNTLFRCVNALTYSITGSTNTADLPQIGGGDFAIKWLESKVNHLQRHF